MNSRNTSIQSSFDVYGSLALGHLAATRVLCQKWHDAYIMQLHIVPYTLNFNELSVDLLKPVAHAEIMFKLFYFVMLSQSHLAHAKIELYPKPIPCI